MGINTRGSLVASKTRCLPPELESTFSEYIATPVIPPNRIIAGMYYKFLAIAKNGELGPPTAG